jgi:DNA-binding Lrp family transcriptional regulator
VADLSLDKGIPQDVIKRKLQGLSVCGRWSTCHNRSRRTGEAGLIKRIKEIVETQMRYSYRRIYVLLGRARWPSENYGNARGR